LDLNEGLWQKALLRGTVVEEDNHPRSDVIGSSLLVSMPG